MVSKVSPGPVSKRIGLNFHLKIRGSNVLVFGVIVVAVLMIAGSVTYASYGTPHNNLQNQAFNYGHAIGSINAKIPATLAEIQSHGSQIASYHPTSSSLGAYSSSWNNPAAQHKYAPSQQQPITTPTVTYFTATDATGKFIRSSGPINITTTGLDLSEIKNSNGSITLGDNISGSITYSDVGFVYYNVGPLGSIQNISGFGNASINLWFDQNGDGEYFTWANNTLTSVSPDRYALGPSNSLSISNSSNFFVIDSKGASVGQSYTLSQLKNGNVSGINASTEVGIWVGFSVSRESTTSSPVSKSTTVQISITRTKPAVLDATRGWGFSSIQAGIVAAQNGDVIQVAPGTYQEQLTINKSLTLEGLGTSADPTVIAPAKVSNIAKSPDTGNPEAPVILVNGSTDVTIENLVVNGSAASSNVTSDLFGYVGILFLGGSGLIYNDTVTDVTPPPPQYGIQSGNAILVQTPKGMFSNVNITNNTVINYQKNGITANDNNTSVIIQGNKVSPLAAAQNVIASNGIQIGFGARGTVKDNTVSGNTYLNPSTFYYATGILDDESPYLLAVSNDIFNNAVGIDSYGYYGNSTSIIAHNTFYNNTFEGIEIDQGGAFVASNTVKGSFAGISAISYLGDTLNFKAVVGDNNISNGVSNSIAIAFFNDYAKGVVPVPVGILLLGQNNKTAPTLVASGNNISGQGIGILVNKTNVSMQVALNASNNRFSNNSIQYKDVTNSTDISTILLHNMFDRAVVVQQDQNFDPEVLTNISDHVIWSNIADAMANSSNGDTVKVLPGTYPTASPIIITASSLWIQSFTGSYNNSGVYLKAVNPEVNLNGRSPSYFQLGGSFDPNTNAGSPVENVLIGGFNFEGAGIEIPGTGAGNITIYSNGFANTSVEAIGYHGNPGLEAPLGTIYVVDNVFRNILGSVSFPGTAIWLGNVVNSFVGWNNIDSTTYAGVILTGTSQGDEFNNTIYSNTISSIPHQGIQIAYGDHDYVALNTITLSGMDWNVNSSGPVLGRDAAISLFNPDQNNITIEFNNLSNSYDGLAIGQVSAFSLFNDSLGAGISFDHNDIFNNFIHYGVANYATGGPALNAAFNWWGGPYGPNTTGSAKVYGNVHYSPSLSLPFNTPTASITIAEFGLAPGTFWSVTLNGATYSTNGNSITVPNNVVLGNNTYLTEFAQGSYNISISVGQPYYFNYWSSNTSLISFENRNEGSTVVAINGSGTITATFFLPLDQSFTLATALNKTVVGTTVSLNATWRNNLPFQQITGIVWFEVENAQTGQTVMITATSLTLAPGMSSSAYLGLSTLAPGTYNVEVFVTTTQGVPISPTATVTITV